VQQEVGHGLEEMSPLSGRLNVVVLIHVQLQRTAAFLYHRECRFNYAPFIVALLSQSLG